MLSEFLLKYSFKYMSLIKMLLTLHRVPFFFLPNFTARKTINSHLEVVVSERNPNDILHGPRGAVNIWAVDETVHEQTTTYPK